MRLKIKKLSLGAGRPVAFIDDKTAKKIRVHAGERIEILFDGRKEVAIVDVVQGLLRKDEISTSDELMEDAHLKPGDYVEVSLSLPPRSISFIAKKLAGQSLSKPRKSNHKAALPPKKATGCRHWWRPPAA